MDKEMSDKIVAAEEKKDLDELVRLTGIPAEVIIGMRTMKRKERRQWYRDNKARLKLPPWGQLEGLEK